MEVKLLPSRTEEENKMPDAITNESPNVNVETALNQARLLNDHWRKARNNQRSLARSLVLAVALDGFAFGPLKDQIRDAMPKLGKEDSASLKTLFSDCGYIADRWHTLPQEMKDAFVTGKMVYSTLKADMRKAEKAKEAADAEAAETERLAALGIDAETDKANAERAADASANVAALERITAMIGRDPSTFTSDETSAFMRMIDALDAMRAATVEQAQAA
jgi:hypothetical protein